MARHRLVRPQLVGRGAALRAVLSCLVVVLVVAGSVAFCDGWEHVVAEAAPRPYAAAQHRPETAISAEQENPPGHSNSVTPVGAQSASDLSPGALSSECKEPGAIWAVSSQSRPVTATDAAQPRPGTLIPDSAGPFAQPPAPVSRRAPTLAQLSISRT
ncbi:hypothetical protein ACVWY0_001947 [Arthrobacter sp. UYNi723]